MNTPNVRDFRASGNDSLMHEPREVVLVTGISGSGKSVALHALEDAEIGRASCRERV